MRIQISHVYLMSDGAEVCGNIPRFLAVGKDAFDQSHVESMMSLFPSASNS